MNLSDLNPIKAVVDKVGDLATRYFPPELDKQKFMLEVQKEADAAQATLVQTAAEDRGSARIMQTQVKSVMPPILAGVAVLGFLGSMGIAFFMDLPDKRMNLIMFLLGVLTALVKDVYGFFFGSSADSHRKTELLGTK